jgi:(S)-mandelate dehydrogenase
MARLDRAASISDLRAMAKRRMPRFAFDWMEGGAEDEINLARNRAAFDAIELVPRYLIDASAPSIETTLFGQTYAAPFGLTPIGFLNMTRPGADLMWARLAARKRIPHVISTACSTPLERVADAADGMAWFQLYASRDLELRADLLSRAKAAGCEVLIVTVDVPAAGKRDRDTRNGMAMPFVFTPSILLDLAAHPAWAVETLLAGAPGFGNFDPRRFKAGGRMSIVETQARMISNDFTWDDLRRLRDAWRGPMIVKGILHPEDAVLVAEAGCDAVGVSNHGGRQADYAPAAIAALPAIAEVVAGRVPILLDSGVRRGADIVRAKALGAEFILSGRAFTYGVAAAGDAGAAKSFEILETELVRTLGQIGRPRFADVDEGVLASTALGGPTCVNRSSRVSTAPRR